MKSNTYFKEAALAALRGNWSKAVLTTLVIVAIALVFSGPNVYTSYKAQAMMTGYSLTSVNDILDMSTDPEYIAIQQQSNGTSALFLLAEIFLLLPLEVGFMNAFRKLLVNMDTDILGNTFSFSNLQNSEHDHPVSRPRIQCFFGA